MIRKTIQRLLRRHHTWRDVGFDELAELYISNMLRSVALTIFMVFVPYFLYQEGYSLAAIFSVFGLFFVVRFVSDILAGHMVARVGPKHTMIASCLLQIISASILLTVPSMHWHPLILALPWGASASFFFIAYHVEFSKIKHTKHAGRELGHMQTYEKLGFLVGPVIGGVVGSVLGPQYIFGAATLLLLASLWPLFKSPEPVKTRQKLDFKGLDVSLIRRDIIANACLGIENTLCINIWAFYVSVFILSGAVYVQLGALTAIGVCASILSAQLIGRFTDTEHARSILRVSAITNSLVYMVRPFVQGIGGVFATNVLNETVTTGYRMPFTKGVYAAADDLPGHRIVYIVALEATNSIGKATMWLFLAILATTLAMKTMVFIGFGIAAVASLGITLEHFAVYNGKKSKRGQLS